MAQTPNDDLDLTKLDQIKPVPANPLSDKLAHEENKDLYEERNKERADGLKKQLHKVFVCFIWIAFITFLILFSVRVLHIILPTYCHWLSPEQIQGIDKLLYSSAIGGFVGRYFNKLA